MNSNSQVENDISRGTEEQPATSRPLLFDAERQLMFEIDKASSGILASSGVDVSELSKLCKVVDYWLGEDSATQIESIGLLRLAKEVKNDYVSASLLAWRGEYKLSFITLRSFLESFCLLLYYLNQGCDRLLYLKGKGYKLMLHRMAQKRPDPDDMHAFRRHYHLLVSESYNTTKAADKFFDEINEYYGILSKAIHGDFSPPESVSIQEMYIKISKRVLVICNTLALHDPVFDATEDDLNSALIGVLDPTTFQWPSQ